MRPAVVPIHGSNLCAPKSPGPVQMWVSSKVGEPSPSLTACVRKIDFQVPGAHRELNEAIEIFESAAVMCIRG
jgi:hypothetical protein